MIIVYDNGKETIVTTRKNEKQTIKEYFCGEFSRDMNEYDRYEYDTNVRISAGIVMSGD